MYRKNKRALQQTPLMGPVVMALAAAFMLAGCGSAAATVAPMPTPVGDAERGEELFSDTQITRCRRCHSLDGSEFRAGPSLQGVSERAGERIPGMSAVDYLRQSIVSPGAYYVEGYTSKQMPMDYADRLSEEEINDLVAFLLTQ